MIHDDVNINIRAKLINMILILFYRGSVVALILSLYNIAQNQSFVQKGVGLIYKTAKYLYSYIHLIFSRLNPIIIHYITLFLLYLYSHI